ncbi:MAG: penicillin-binding protein 2 [Parcubacteria group bacterium Athens1014_10]|nr:MAG: penicillin-binding protein 2 [Parcubacteria group bacterium Athens1014_10]TSD04706.1 MAG: penicillin-binding protein 2 [Parcubacteria group bacterium Athens0714_12]
MKDPFIIQIDKIKNNEINNYSKNRFEGDVFPFNFNIEYLKPVIEKKDINKLFALIIFGITILFFYSFYLQIAKGDYYRNTAEGNRLRIQFTKANRGIIYDRNKEPLVKNIPRFSLYIIPGDLPKENKENSNFSRQEILNKLSQILEKPRSDIENLIQDIPSYSYQPVLIEDNLDYKTALLLKIKSQFLRGVVLNTETRREYLDGNEFSHLLGYLSKISPKELEAKKGQYLFNDRLGKTGLEFFYENLLKGEDGKKQIEVDSLGKEERIVSTLPAKSGKNLVLTIDSGLQKELASALKEKYPNKKATAVALNPKNGEILALVSQPDFDSNDFAKGISQEDYQKLKEDKNNPFLFRAISGEYPSGSTVKLVIASAALQEGIIDVKTKIHSTGGIRIGKWFYGDWKAGGHGLTDVTKALAESVNTFFYYLGGGYQDFKGLGLENIRKYAQLFGLSEKTGIDLPNEASGFLPTEEWKEETKNEVWYIGDTYHLSIGQGDLLVTPLQVANFTAIIANGGIYYKPHLVKEIIGSQENDFLSSENFKESLEIKPEIIRENFISPENINLVKKGLREAVLSGSARALADLPVEAAGKTGTAEVGGDKETHAWFTCFAPYEDPEIVITVLVENGGDGSSVALPVAKKVLNWYFSK